MDSKQVADLINETVADGYPDYNMYAHSANSIILFRDKTLNEWTEALNTPVLPHGANINQLEAYNFEILKINEVVIRNLAYARASLATSKMLYKRKLDEEKARLFEAQQESTWIAYQLQQQASKTRYRSHCYVIPSTLCCSVCSVVKKSLSNCRYS